jgi:NTP pyrophosphatase (non-canonical NTP hydrolase)
MKNTQKKVEKYLKARKWDKNEPIDISKSIIIEGAELMELFQWNNPKRKQVLANHELVSKIKGELADVLIYALGMAITLDLDADKLIEEKLKHVEKKYPVYEIKKGRSQYLKIKQDYRRKHA